MNINFVLCNDAILEFCLKHTLFVTINKIHKFQSPFLSLPFEHSLEIYVAIVPTGTTPLGKSPVCIITTIIHNLF